MVSDQALQNVGRQHVICLGNPLHGDDGFGPAVFEALQAQTWGESVGVYCAGTRGLDAVGLFADCAQAIVVDAMPGDPADGKLGLLDVRDLAAAEPAMIWHGAGLEQLLALLPVCLEKLPTIQVLVARTELPVPFRETLSPATRQAVGRAVEWVQQQVSGAVYA